MLNGLKDYTKYEIVLQAYTKAGPGPDSNPFIERTNEGGSSCSYFGEIEIYIIYFDAVKDR